MTTGVSKGYSKIVRRRDDAWEYMKNQAALDYETIAGWVSFLTPPPVKLIVFCAEDVLVLLLDMEVEYLKFVVAPCQRMQESKNFTYVVNFT